MSTLTNDQIARVLFAETGEMEADPGAVVGADLAKVRAVLAWMIGRSDDGLGFARPREPTVGDLGNPSLLTTWQACNAAAASPLAPPLVNQREPDVVFFSAVDPLTDSATVADNPWLQQSPGWVAVGSFCRKGAVQKMFLCAGTTAPRKGRYPDGQPDVQSAVDPLVPGFKSRKTGTLAFLLVLFALIISGLWAAPAPKNMRAHSLAAERTARSNLDQALKHAQEAASAVQAMPNAADLAATDKKAREAAQHARDVYADAERLSLHGPWILAMAGLIALFALISYGMRGQPMGFLIDERGRMSLARLQFVAWTILILATYWTTSAWNIAVMIAFSPINGASIVFPMMEKDLWLLLGIVNASPLVSSLILDSKSQQTPTSRETTPGHVDRDVANNKGLVDTRTDLQSWSFLDIFVGEYVGNRNSVDVSRVQQFVFTLLSLIGYGTAVCVNFDAVDNQTISEIPHLGMQAVGLLALSHSAYLAAKGIQK